jgi:signal recognition particle subunit SRP54
MGLGDQLRNAIEKLRNSSSVDKDAVKEAVKELQRALISGDVEISLVLQLSKQIENEAFKDLPKGVSRREHVVKVLYDSLAEVMGGSPSVPEKPKKIMLVGLFGSGKTTTTGKLAKWYSKRGMKVGVIAADTFRPAAYEQLEQVSKIAKVGFFGIRKEKNAAKVVKEALANMKGYDLLICDSAGRSALDNELVEEVKEIDKAFDAEEKWLVIGADIGQTAKKQAKAFHDAIGVNGIIITKMDGSAKGGGALTACHATEAPVYFIGIGEKVDDLQEFDAQRYLSRIMGYGDLAGLLEKIKEAQEEEEIDVEEIMQGEFTIETFYQQLKAARKIGPLNKIAEMMGMGAQIPKEMLEVGEEKLNGFKVMIDSMTVEERRNPEVLNKSRIARIGRGSGRTQEQVRELIRQYRTMAKMFKQLKGLDEKKLQSGGLQGLLGKMKGAGKKKRIKFR